MQVIPTLGKFCTKFVTASPVCPSPPPPSIAMEKQDNHTSKPMNLIINNCMVQELPNQFLNKPSLKTEPTKLFHERSGQFILNMTADVLGSAIGFIVYTTMILYWALTFSIGGEQLFCSSWKRLAIYIQMLTLTFLGKQEFICCKWHWGCDHLLILCCSLSSIHISSPFCIWALWLNFFQQNEVQYTSFLCRSGIW